MNTDRYSGRAKIIFQQDKSVTEDIKKDDSTVMKLNLLIKKISRLKAQRPIKPQCHFVH